MKFRRACSITKSIPTLCNPMDCSLPGSSVYGISQARILEWVANSSTRGWHTHACMHAKSLELRPTLCDPMDCSLPGSSVYAILQARILERVVMPSSGIIPNPGIKPSVLCLLLH